MTKEEKAAAKAAKKAERKAKGEGLWNDFKKFISKGNVLDMAVGVIIGGAFNAIVTALVNILMSVCTWGVPGGLKGLITVLPAANDAQKGMEGIGQFFSADQLQNLARSQAISTYGESTVENTPTLIENVKATILSKYTLHGTTYTYNMSAVIDWGTFINAVISFLIIALTLFVIVKIVAALNKKRLEFEANAREAYYQKPPEERPAPVVPGAPKPTQEELLTAILAELKKQNGEVEKPAE